MAGSVEYRLSESPSPGVVHDAAVIPRLTHTEAAALAQVELDRFLALLDSLASDDWTRPTACPLWDVRQMVAHIAGAEAAYARWPEFRRQFLSPGALRPYQRSGLSMLDALNQVQVDDRADCSPAELIAELRDAAPRAIATRLRLPALLRAIRLPLPILGIVRIDYLTDLIYTRDMWMHRLDICDATGRAMDLTAEHDGRIIALVVRDLAAKLGPRLDRRPVVYELTGPAGGVWQIGRDGLPIATIQMDALDFTRLAAGRLTSADARSRAVLTGEREIANLALDQTAVPF